MVHETLYDEFHALVKKLTGSSWCPYPSESFMRAIMVAPEGEAVGLIFERRKFTFPSFLGGDPQQEKINKILNK